MDGVNAFVFKYLGIAFVGKETGKKTTPTKENIWQAWAVLY